MNGEFKLPTDFLYWWLLKAPKRIFLTLKRVLILTNNALSFTVNVRLIFTPLFGDYTLIGRFIGFVIRIFEITFGSAFIILISAATLSLPVLWLIAPLALFYYIKFLVVPLYILIYLLWAFMYSNTPKKRVTEVANEEILLSFRPTTKFIYNQLNTNFGGGLKTLCQLGEIKYLLFKAEINHNDFTEKLLTSKKVEVKDIGTEAFNIAKKNKIRYVEPEHLFVALIKYIPANSTLLASFGSNVGLLEETARWVVDERERLAKIYIWQEDCDVLIVGGFGKGMTGRVTPLLDSVSEDFTKLAKNGRMTRIVGRDKEIKKIAELLTGSRENILIIGEAGSGKTAIVRGMAHRIIEGTEYKALRNKRIVSLNIGSFISGTRTPGEIADKLTKIMNEIKGSRDIILFIDETHNLLTDLSDDKSGSSLVYSILEPYLISDDTQFIGAATVANYRKYIEPNHAFSRLFNIVEITETSKEDTIDILKDSCRKIQGRYHVSVTYPALNKIVTLSNKLIHERVLPDKALDVLNRTVTRVTETTKVVNSLEVTNEISEMTHIPTEAVSQDDAQKLLKIEDAMKGMVIGQDHAIKQIGSALRRASVGVRSENKPIASFLFVGTTGVGKTQTAKALAKTYFGDLKAMVRLDMSEYQQLDSIDRLIGAPDGTTKGILTEAVRSKPFTLVLLDELEKAHPNILLTFLQVLDDARLTDSSGTVVDFSNTIIIATSNVGTKLIQEVFTRGGSVQEMNDVAMKEVRAKYAPEFLNRFTGITVFNPLTMDNVRAICNLLLKDVKNIADEKNIKLGFKPELIEELIKRGYSPEWGARPLARLIEDTVESYLATKILRNEVKQGDQLFLGTEVFEAAS